MNTTQLLQHIEQRPWGEFIQFTHNQASTVKIITVQPGASLSLQYHNHRTEYWYVISGSGSAIIGESTVELEEGKIYTVEAGQNHRMSATTPMRVLEISFGDFDEQDIVRLSDNYGRDTVS